MADDLSPIRMNAEFSSWAEFEAAFNRWRIENGHPLRISSSEMLREERGIPREIQERFRYRYTNYNCMHFGVPRLRGSGQRTNQAYMPCGCKARVRLTYFPDEEKLRVTKFVDEHNGHGQAISNEGSAKTRGRYMVALKQFIPFNWSSPGSSGCGSPAKMPVFDISVQEKYVQQLRDRQQKNYRIVARRRAAKGLPILDNEFPPITEETAPVFQKLSDTELMSPELHKEMTMMSYKLLRKKLLLLSLQKEVDLLSVLGAQQPPQNPVLAPQYGQIGTALRPIPPQFPDPSQPNPLLDSILTLPPSLLEILLRNPPVIPNSFPSLSSETTVTPATTVAPRLVAPPAGFLYPFAPSPALSVSSSFPVLPTKSVQKVFGTEVPNGHLLRS